ncbi:Hpt domain-containing protein [Carboxylicivirga sediminis]|uniref:Hpt domain-containing protein n=1 Tax=Carboxylicivirga sediminis TaxID=2006564 RepID=A0A941F0I5_9BACT|nr:Hpt domain-containing protein [Carboxylicivirga sediminis]MBR8534626.1 Hpt domain-containing protein [Carboxylicivirga sediminis]
MPNPYTHINLNYLESITDGSQELIKELVSIFIEQIPEFRDGFDEGLAQKDWSKIAAVAHKAKSSVMSMGMDDLGNTDLKNLELLAKLLKIDELSQCENNSEEALQLQKSLESYSSDRKDWLNANKSEGSIEAIITRFNQTCEAAISELQDVLEN